MLRKENTLLFTLKYRGFCATCSTIRIDFTEKKKTNCITPLFINKVNVIEIAKKGLYLEEDCLRYFFRGHRSECF